MLPPEALPASRTANEFFNVVVRFGGFNVSVITIVTTSDSCCYMPIVYCDMCCQRMYGEFLIRALTKVASVSEGEKAAINTNIRKHSDPLATFSLSGFFYRLRRRLQCQY